MNFNELPIEIIRMIFYIHAYEHIGSKRTLLRTCRTWYNVASNYATLWRAIHWHSSNPSTTVHPDDQCVNLGDLAQDIGRTGTMTFDLVLGFPIPTPRKIDQRVFADRVNRDVLSRCRSLRLYTSMTYRNMARDVVATIITIITPLGGELPSLEHLSINEMERGAWGDALDTLISQVADSAINLQSLELFSWFWPHDIGKRVFQYPNLMYRIRKLTLKYIEGVPWEEFPNLEHLDYTLACGFTGGPHGLSKLVAPRLTSLCLDGDFEDAELPPHALFNQLTHMVLRDFYSNHAAQGRAFPSSFSCLSSLGIQNHRPGGWLEHINMEKPLEELILGNVPSKYFERGLSVATFRPRVLRVDTIRDLPSYYVLGEPVSLWNRVEEIHVIVKEDALWDWFTLALSKPANGQHSSQECYPLLRVFTVIYPDKDQDSEQKQMQMQKLRAIQRGRHKSGIRLLETLRVGWYHPCDHILTVPYAGRHVMQWGDCLEDWSP